MKDDDKVTLARLTVIAGLMLAVSIIVGLLLGRARAGPAVEKVIPDSAWADTPECQALKRSTGGSNVPIPDNCEVGMADMPEKPPARVTVAPPYQGPPPIGWVYKPYTTCLSWPYCSTVFVSVQADGLNVRTVPNGPATMALVNGTPIIPV